MSLLLSAQALEAREHVAHGSLEPQANSLAADLEPLVGRDIYFPVEKALLSREGGRCSLDGILLDFDPASPREHRCPRCGSSYRGEVHDRFWVYWYQLWLAERAVHAAVLSRLGDKRFEPLAVAILDGYAERYAAYPNVDNVLGPSRLFFSTYLESIWLLQICVALDLIESSRPSLGQRVRERIIEPSSRIIAEYDEGGSNRQVWNDVALLAAARLLGDQRGAERSVFGPSGLVDQLTHGLLVDGTWYEGENYHLFAHRGLWYGVTMAERAGMMIPPDLVARFDEGFATPFATALPDFTLPSRRDSQYAISLRQWRIAEHCELGFARGDDGRLLAALDRMYDATVLRGQTNRSRSSADVERNVQSSGLTRSDLSWRALLFARAALPSGAADAPRSTVLAGQGIAVFRRDGGQIYVALDYGHPGGGHGHPDRLNLLLANGATRWLDDYGTGSYVEPSLHWYRSTLAHNAPLVDGRSQLPVRGELLAYDERGAAGWIVARANEVAPGVAVTRTIVALSSYLIDEVEWQSAESVAVDIPLHVDVIFDDIEPPQEGTLSGQPGTEDGFRFAHDAACQRVGENQLVHGRARRNDGETLEIWSQSDHAAEWWRATAPGPPGTAERSFRLVRATGRTGRQRTLLTWSNDVESVAVIESAESLAAAAAAAELRVTMRDGSVHLHRRTGTGWQIELTAGGARSSIDLGGRVASPAAAETVASPASETPALSLSYSAEQVIELGELHYRRSEQSWQAAGKPMARVTLRATPESLGIRVEVPVSDLQFAPPNAVNVYDNEMPDVNGDSVQLYLDGDTGQTGWMLVPELGSSSVRVREIEGWPGTREPRAVWEKVGDGYRLDVEIAPPPRAIDLIVNEMPRGRLRRRGQLVLSGSRGEFIYLRGDRHDRARLLPLRLSDD